MQRRTPSQSVSPSFTALTTILAFKNALKTQYGSLFSTDDIRFTNHMVATAIAHEPGYFKWILEQGLAKSPYGAQRFFLDRTFAPGYVQQKCARKLMIKRKIEHDIEREGLQQIVFLSGGYDPRGFITAQQHPDVQVYELDRGDTRKIKLKAFQTLPDGFNTTYKDFHYTPLHTAINGNYHLVECDFLKDNLQAVLTRIGFDLNKKTLFIAEGLTMYLPESDNIKLLQAIAGLSPQSCEILLSYRSKIINQALGTVLQSSSQETYAFGMMPEEVAKFVGALGFSLSGIMLYSHLLKWVHSQTNDVANTTTGREHYYLLKKTPALLLTPPKQLTELPLITDALPSVTRTVMKSRL